MTNDPDGRLGAAAVGEAKDAEALEREMFEAAEKQAAAEAAEEEADAVAAAAAAAAAERDAALLAEAEATARMLEAQQR